MPDDKLREAVRAASSAALRKLVASKGALQGHYYFAGDARLRDAALFVTLSARDPKGQTARTRGKALRKDVKQARFSVGTVRVIDRKLTFEVLGGNAPRDLLKKSFKQSLNKLDGLSILKKARVTALDTSDDEDDDDVAEVGASDVGLSEEALRDLSEVLERDPELAAFFDDEQKRKALADQDAQLRETFLSASALAAETEAQRTQLRAELSDLDDGIRAAETAEARAALVARYEEACDALASLSPSGPPLGSGDTLPEELRPLVTLSVGLGASLLAEQHAAAAAKITDLYEQMMALPEPERAAFAREHLDPLGRHQATTRGTFKQLKRTATEQSP